MTAVVTVGDALRLGTAALGAKTESPRADAHRLLAHALGRQKAWLLANPEQPLAAAQVVGFFERLERRSRGLPLAYILRSWSFYGLEFEINTDVLVPRPETEALVEAALEFLKGLPSDGRPRRILDVGTGSGAIACVIAVQRADTLVDATDISAEAIELAQRNASLLGVRDRCTFYAGDLAIPVAGRRYDCVIANLPYIARGDLPRKPDPVAYEPQVALDGGADGLTTYRRLLPQLPALLRPQALVLLEAAAPTFVRLHGLAVQHFAQAEVRIGRDCGAQDCMIVIHQGDRGQKTE